MITEAYQTGINKIGKLRYRIQVRCSHGHWQHRHVWFDNSRSFKKVIFDDWLYFMGNKRPFMHFGYKPVKARDLDNDLPKPHRRMK